jgi:hypothetical protein
MRGRKPKSATKLPARLCQAFDRAWAHSDGAWETWRTVIPDYEMVLGRKLRTWADWALFLEQEYGIPPSEAKKIPYSSILAAIRDKFQDKVCRRNRMSDPETIRRYLEICDLNRADPQKNSRKKLARRYKVTYQRISQIIKDEPRWRSLAHGLSKDSRN